MPQPNNEPILGFAPGSQERADLQVEMDRQMGEVIEIPCIINGEEVFTGTTTTQVIPHNHGHVLACLLYTSPSPRDAHESRMPSSA